MASGGKSSSASRRDSDSTDPEGHALAAAGDAAPPIDRTDPGASVPAAPAAAAPAAPPAPSRPATAAAGWKLAVLRGPKAGSEFVLDADEMILGRGADNPISIPDVSVSRRHVRFKREGDSILATDLQSGNGTRVNGAKITNARLSHGDEIALGDTTVQLVKIGTAVAPRGRAAAEAAPVRVAAPSAPTEAPMVRVKVAPTRQMTAPVLIPPKKAAPAPAPTGNPRLKIYGVVAVVLILLIVVANFLKHSPAIVQQDQQVEVVDRFDPIRVDTRQHKWNDATRKLTEMSALEPADEKIKRWAEAARTEADAQKLSDGARASLLKGDYKSAIELASKVNPDTDFGTDADTLLKGMPTTLGNAVKDARAAFTSGDKEKAREIVERVLAASPSQPDAKALLDEIQRPPIRRKEKEKEKEKAPPPPPPGPRYTYFGAAVTAYLQDDLKSAMRSADNAGDETNKALSKLLREFSQHYQKAVDLAQGKHIPEAAQEFGQARAIDDKIAAGRPSSPGKSVRTQFANMHYLLSLDCKGDDQLPRKAQHLLWALNADPNNEAAKKAQDKVYAHARELFTDAYISAPSNPDDAIKKYKIIIQTLPAGDPTKDKATLRLAKLQGQPQQ